MYTRSILRVAMLAVFVIAPAAGNADVRASAVFHRASQSVVAVNRHVHVPLIRTSEDDPYAKLSEVPVSGGSGVIVSCPIEAPLGYAKDSWTTEEVAEFYTDLKSGRWFGTCIVTNCHVIGQSGPVVVTTEGASRETGAGLRNDALDLCMVGTYRYGDPSYLPNPTARIGSSTELKIGDPVFAVGNPSGLTNTLTTGVVSGFRKEGKVDLIQISAPISPGSSGGGLFDRNGKLIGITTSKIEGAEALGFAIPIDAYATLWEDDFQYKQRFAGHLDWEYTRRMLVQRHASDWAALLRSAETMIDLDPYNADGWYYSGMANLKMSNHSDAMAHAYKSVELDPTGQNLTLLGGTYLSLRTSTTGSDRQESKWLASAIEFFEKATVADPYYGHGWELLSIAYYLNDWPEQVVQSADRAISLNSATSIAWSTKGWAHFQLGEMPDAHRSALKATEVDPDSTEDWRLLGVVSSHIGADEDVLRAYQNLRRLDPDMAELFFSQLELVGR